MASMYGADATALSGPQGAGSAPLAAVQEPAGLDLSGGITQLLGGVANSAIQYQRSQEASKQPAWMTVRNSFQKEAAGYLQQMQTATDSATRTVARNKLAALKASTLAQGADFGIDFAKSINDTWNFLNTGSGIDESKEQAKYFEQQKLGVISDAAKYGLVFPVQPENASPDQINQMAELVNIKRAAQSQEEDALQKAQQSAQLRSSQQSEARFQWELSDREAKQSAEAAMAGHYNAFAKQTLMLDQQWQTENPGTDLNNKISSYFVGQKANVRSQFASVPGTRDSLIKSLEEVEKLTMDMYNPEQTSKVTASQVKQKRDLMMMELTSQNPNLAKLGVITDLIGPNAMANAVTGVQIEPLLTDLLKTRKGGVSDLMTGPAADMNKVSQAMTLLSSRVKDANSGTVANPDQAKGTVAEHYSGYLRSLNVLPPGQSLDLGKMMQGLAAPEFGQLVKEGRIGQNERVDAINNLQKTYINSWSKNASVYLNSPVTGSDGPRMAQLVEFVQDPNGTISPRLNKDSSVNWDGKEIDYRMVMQRSQVIANDLNRSLAAFTNLVGNKNKVEMWEATRHLYFPNFYPNPVAEAGQTESALDRAKKLGWNGSGFIQNKSAFTQKEGQ